MVADAAPVRLQVVLPQHTVDLRGVVVGGTPDACRLERELGFLMAHGRHTSLEDAARVLARWLQLPPTGAGAAWGRLTLTVTDAAGGAATHTATPAPYDQEPDKPWGWVDIVHEGADVGVYRLVLTQGVLPTHVHAVMVEHELVLDDGLEGWRDGGPARRLPVGETVAWRHGQPHGYRHVGAGPASLLCIDSPPFDPDDERILDTEPPP